MDRYIGIDAHSASCTIAVIGPSGKRISSQVVETNGAALVGAVKAIPGRKCIIFEEGDLAAWLYEILEPFAHQIIVVRVTKRRRGSKSDEIDAFELAESLRIGSFENRVYKKVGQFAVLAELVKAHQVVMYDSVRCQNRIKGLYRSRAIPTTGKQDLYSTTGRSAYLKRLPDRSKPRALTLYTELDLLLELRKSAEKEMIAEAKRHPVFQTIKTIPGLGDLRVSQMMPRIITPYRFRSKRSFWRYVGLAIETRSSSDWERDPDGIWQRAQKEKTRGLNRNYNRPLKNIFKGAATTVIQSRRNDPIYHHYCSLLDGGTKPPLAKLTIARQIASITLGLWKSGKEYDPKALKKE
jgi:transposase